MTTLEHAYTLRGGPFDGRTFNYSGFVDYRAPEPHGPYSRVCDKVHEEHAKALLDFPTMDHHCHEYDYGTDHPDDVNYVGTCYVSLTGWKAFRIRGTKDDSI